MPLNPVLDGHGGGIVNRRLLLAIVMLIVVGPASAGEKKVTHKAGRVSFTLILPDGYTLASEARPRAGFQLFGFATDPRSDGTRGLIQVSILDFEAMKAGPFKLEKVASQMIGAIQTRRSEWQATETRVAASAVPAIRVDWSGGSAPDAARPSQLAPAKMRGIMITGIKDGVGFSLHTQDIEPITETAIPLGEKALLSFAMRVR